MYLKMTVGLDVGEDTFQLNPSATIGGSDISFASPDEGKDKIFNDLKKANRISYPDANLDENVARQFHAIQGECARSNIF